MFEFNGDAVTSLGEYDLGEPNTPLLKKKRYKLEWTKGREHCENPQVCEFVRNEEIFNDGCDEDSLLGITDYVSISIEKDIIKKFVRRVYKIKPNGELEVGRLFE